ncbi:MAG: hypothetical protein WC260_02265 [Candidatus Pacearchaeota archaeon]
MALKSYIENIQEYIKWTKDYSTLNKEIKENSSLDPSKADYYRMQIRDLKNTYSKNHQLKKLNLLELKVCSKEF